MKNNFIIYSQEGCKWCEKAEELLTSLGYGYAVRDIADPEHRKYFNEQGFKTVPQVYIVRANSLQHVGGYSDLLERIG